MGRILPAKERRRQQAVARGLSHVLPVFVTAAGGGIVLDADGNSFIDFGSGIAVTTIGNSTELVVDRVTEQVAEFTHTCFMVTPYRGYVEVCEELNRLTPGDFEKRSALFNSGAEAVENAVKIARHATGRSSAVVFDHAYHGRTNLTMAMTAKNMPYKDGFGPFASDVYRMPMAYPFRWPGGPAACRADALDTITSLIHTQVGEKNVAAVVIAVKPQTADEAMPVLAPFVDGATVVVSIMAASAVASQLVSRIGARPLMIVGPAVMTGGMFWLSRLTEHDTYLGGMLGPISFPGGLG